MADREAPFIIVGDNWKIQAAGPRRKQNGDVDADLLLSNGAAIPVVASRATINTPEGRRAWITEALGDNRPTEAEFDTALLNLLVEILAVLQDEQRPSQADGLVNIVNVVNIDSNDLSGGVTFWHDQRSDPWATITVGEHREHWPLGSKTFRRWLSRQYHDKHEKAPSSTAITDAISVLAGKAIFDGPQCDVYTRIAEHEGHIYLDLGDEDWRAVEVRAAGWDVITNPPVRFRRAAGMLPLPEPQRGGALDLIFKHLNVDEMDQVLIKAYLVQAVRPRGPYPVLGVYGEQGSAKTTLSRGLRSVIDPNISPSRAEPRDARDLVIAATNGAIVVLDNVSTIRDWLSDAICRTSTGGGLSTRSLYTDDEEQIFDVMRPVIITAITDVAVRGDLLDRAIVITLPAIAEEQRKPEAGLWKAFNEDRPLILGALLDRVSQALRDVATVQLPRLPRMADFALWAYASMPDDERQIFIERYAANRTAANETVVESSLVASAVLDFMSTQDDWLGSYKELLDALTKNVGEKAEKAKEWPKSPRGLSGALRRLAPNLKHAGVIVNFDPETARETGSGRKQVQLTKPANNVHNVHNDQGDEEDPHESAENVCEHCGRECEHCECWPTTDDQRSQQRSHAESAETRGKPPESEDCEHCEHLDGASSPQPMKSFRTCSRCQQKDWWEPEPGKFKCWHCEPPRTEAIS